MITRNRRSAVTHIEPLLCAHLFDQQNLWDAQLDADVRDGFSVDKVLLQPNMPPHGLHHAQAHGVEIIADADRGKLVGDCAASWLKPSDKGLVSLQLSNHALAVRRRLVWPVDAAFHHLVTRHVHDAHRIIVRWVDEGK